MLQILQIYHAGSRVDGPSQVTVASNMMGGRGFRVEELKTGTYVFRFLGLV